LEIGVLRKVVLVAASAALLLPATTAAEQTSVELMPRITYTHDARRVGGERVVFHVASGPQPGGLYDLRPVLSNSAVTGVETLTGMQRGMLRRANVVGVNGDFFSWELGNPSGIFVEGGVLKSTPNPLRSSLGIGFDGLLRIATIRYAGTFQIGAAGVRTLKQFNRPFSGDKGFALYSRSWGARTPAVGRTSELILEDLGRTFPNRDRAAIVGRLVEASGHTIPNGGAILQARGKSRGILRAEATRGLTLTFQLGLDNWWDGVKRAIGGGPLLVRGGVAVYRPGDEFFSSDLLNQRHPRTAVGQTAEGRIVLLVADGRRKRSNGLTMNQLANAMVHYGAERAMALDGGGSSELAFNGRVFNHPSDGRERALAESLQLVYTGAYAPRPKRAVFSPNGDGYRDRQRLFGKFVRRSDVHLQVFRPDDTLKWDYQARRDPGMITKDLGPRPMREGTWRWVVEGTDLSGRDSRMTRRFRVNNTLGFLELSKRTMRVRSGRGGQLRIGFRSTHVADVRVNIEREGKVIRHLVFREGLGAGAYAVIWNGRNDGHSVVRSGRFTAVVRAQNSLGSVDIRKGFAVERVT
jgi:hypothetical protein